MAIKVGDKIPEVTLYGVQEKGVESFSTSQLMAGKRVVLFGVPGPFTPICSQVHAPGFLEYADDFYERGVDRILCVAVSDPFAMDAWADAMGADAEILFLGDGNGDLTRAMGLEFDGRYIGLGTRSKRYVLFAQDGIIRLLHVEESPDLCTVSGAKLFLDALIEQDPSTR